MEIGREDLNKLKELEESLWIPATRFDYEYMKRVLSPSFFEFGRSGRIYKREDTLAVPEQEISIKLPLECFEVNPIGEDAVLVTYKSEVMYDKLLISNRSSLWLKTPAGWQIMFHQGTPVD